MQILIFFIFLPFVVYSNTSYDIQNLLNKLNETNFKQIVGQTVEEFCKNTIDKKNCKKNFFNNLEFKIQNNNDKNTKLINSNPYKVWGFALGAATLICFLSCMGSFCLGSKMNKYLEYTIMVIQAFAVGVLSGNALIHLIPDGLGLDESNYPYATSKSLIVGFTFVLFCIVDQIIMLIGTYKATKQIPKINKNDINDNKSDNRNEMINTTNKLSVETPLENKDCNNARINFFGTMIESKGLMIIIGDMLHNFIDGLTIGIMFSQSIPKGLIATIAVISEEVPHEIGDLTILITSGFNVIKALIWNMICCLTCHLGVIVVLLLGNINNNVVDFIEMICGGAFLYISFCSVYPHVMNSALILANKKIKNYCINLVVIYFMIIIGQSLMALVTLFDDYIE